MNNSILLGAHISTAGGLHLAAPRAVSINASTMQIFTKSNRTWFDKKISDSEAILFKESIKNNNLHAIVAHAAYLINIASSSSETEKKSIASLQHELERAGQLAIPYLVLHPGSHTGSGETIGIQKIAKNLLHVLETVDNTTTILLEVMAGQGTNLGNTFEQLAEILRLTSNHHRIGICLDTCHLYSAGYDISTQELYDSMVKQYDAILGLKTLQCIHLNNSKTSFKSHKDRHEELEKGTIPFSIFTEIVHDQRFATIPKILETPTDPAMNLYRNEIIALKKKSF